MSVTRRAAFGSGNWQCCSGDGTNHSCTSMGIAPSASTDYEIEVDWSVAGTLTCRVGSTTTTKTTNLSTASVNLNSYVRIQTHEAVAKVLTIYGYQMEQNQ